MNFDKQGEKLERRLTEYYATISTPVPMKLKFVRAIGNLFIIRIKFVAGTTERKILNSLGDAQQTLRLQLLQLHREGMDLFFIASEHNTFDNRLFGILTSPLYPEYTKDMEIPFPMGFNPMRRPVIVDLALHYRWLIGGEGTSGKTTSLKCLIASILWSCSPEQVNFFIIDEPVDLIQFSELPHLACPVIHDIEAGYKAVMRLHIEMKRRFKLKEEHPAEFNRQPNLVCVIDECVSFVTGIGDKQASQSLADTISLLLRMGRHAKIYMVLATQNATLDDMKCDLKPISSRISFKYSRHQDSSAILNESVADKIQEVGGMYFKSRDHSGLMYLKGAKITDDEIEAVCNHIRTKYENTQWDSTHKFTIDLDTTTESIERSPYIKLVVTTQEVEDKLFARIIIWTLERETVSANAVSIAFASDKVGERHAKRLIERLHSFGIIGEANERQPRKVLITCVEDLPDEVRVFLDRYGCTKEGGEPNAPK